jgi:DNA-directed RNA polymerase subunit RPC12/RpoP
MSEAIDSRCVDCGATFPRSVAASAGDDGLSCPTCGHTVIQGIPEQHGSLGMQENTRCAACEATFPRGQAKTETKGVLACPDCGSTTDLVQIDDTKDT